MTALDVALENADHKCIKLLQRYGARTAHYILTQAANIIRTTWKNYRKRKVARGEAIPLANSSSIYTSSNASESVSTKGMWRLLCCFTMIQRVNFLFLIVLHIQLHIHSTFFNVNLLIRHSNTEERCTFFVK